jgi:5S rRNA maturation endonuclease (ribonuclease M5)
MRCCFNESCNDSSYGALTVNLADPARVIYCHVCQVRGNLLTLIHGLTQHRPPTGGRLRGDEFKAAVATLLQIRGGAEPASPSAVHTPVPAATSPTPPLSTPPEEPVSVNTPLKDQEKTRGLVNLWEDFVVEIDQMSPAAASYFRERPWLTPEVCRQWKMGYLPRDGRSLLRGLIVYAHTNEAGDILSYSGRDPTFADKWNEWVRAGRPEKSRPMKHRYVKGYHKGLELYGQSADRLQDRRLRDSLSRIGLVIVEGMNDVIRLNELGVAAVGVCSNQATDEQLEKLTRFARAVAGSRIVLVPDNDDEGESGFKDLLWSLAERGLDVRLAWSRRSHNSQFNGKQPEDLTPDDWQSLLPHLTRPR